MIDLRQQELKKWHDYNFGEATSLPEWQVLGVCEEAGELAHAILKMRQGIRESTKEDAADAFGDIVIYGIQVMTLLGIDAEEAIRKTVSDVLKRDWKRFPKNGTTE